MCKNILLLVLCLLGRFKCLTSPFLSLLSLFFQLPISFHHHPVQHHLSLDLFPSIFPSITVFNSDSPLRACPIHFFCLVFIVRMRDISSPIVSNISSFVLCSVQLTFSILLQVHISKASSLFISSFLIVHVSAPYSTTLHISVFIIRIFNVLFTLPLKSSLLFENASFPIAILLLISLWHLASVVITLPRQQNSFTCSISFPPMLILTIVSFPLLIFSTFVFLMLIFIPYSLDVLSNLSIIVCRPF